MPETQTTSDMATTTANVRIAVVWVTESLNQQVCKYTNMASYHLIISTLAPGWTGCPRYFLRRHLEWQRANCSGIGFGTTWENGLVAELPAKALHLWKGYYTNTHIPNSYVIWMAPCEMHSFNIASTGLCWGETKGISTLRTLGVYVWRSPHNPNQTYPLIKSEPYIYSRNPQ